MLAFLNTSFFNAFSPFWYALEHGIRGEAHRALAEYGYTMAQKAHAKLNTLLEDRQWLLGERRTLADAYFAGPCLIEPQGVPAASGSGRSASSSRVAEPGVEDAYPQIVTPLWTS